MGRCCGFPSRNTFQCALMMRFGWIKILRTTLWNTLVPNAVIVFSQSRGLNKDECVFVLKSQKITIPNFCYYSLHDLVIHNNQFSKGNLLSLAYWINRKYNAKFRVRISAFATKIVDLKCMPFAMHVGVTYLWKTLDLTINIVQPLRKKKHLYFSCKNYLS